jgi:hypothetical protein
MAAMFVNRTEQDEISNLYRGLSIDASYQVSVQLAKQFQGRRFLEINQSETRIACGGQHTHTHILFTPPLNFLTLYTCSY